MAEGLLQYKIIGPFCFLLMTNSSNKIFNNSNLQLPYSILLPQKKKKIIFHCSVELGRETTTCFLLFHRTKFPPIHVQYLVVGRLSVSLLIEI